VLLELHVAGLGVIDDSTLEFEEGLTALTGETGAGKTLLVDALALVMGSRPRRGIVQTGRTALIEARFLDSQGDELILAREIPADGRARAWIDGRMASVAALAERSKELCDIHGQHEHQSLLGSGAFRDALDTFAVIDSNSLHESRAELRALKREARSLGGSAEAIDHARSLAEHELDEIVLARLDAPEELDQLLETARLLEGAEALRTALARSLEQLEGREGGGPRDAIAGLRGIIEGYESFGPLRSTLRDAESTLDELVSDLRHALEAVEEDPERLADTNLRLQQLHQLCRRYGPSLADVIRHQGELEAQLAALDQAEHSRQSIQARIEAAALQLHECAAEVEKQRLDAAPRMESVLMDKLGVLALDRARVSIKVDGDAGDEVVLYFSANPGLPVAPFASVVSGGELARLMLAVRLALPGGPPTMVFDEVDTGVGGATAVALAEALKDVATTRQVLVVTHLAQVAAAADHQISVVKDGGTLLSGAQALVLDAEGRIRELARMLSGQPESETARQHARELLGL
jgi:DNA repair protein RecN (Recombination protein N)